MISLIDLSVTAVIGVCLIAICFVNHPAAYKVIAAVLATSMIAGSLASVRFFPQVYISLSTTLTIAGTSRRDPKVSTEIEMARGVP